MSSASSPSGCRSNVSKTHVQVGSTSGTLALELWALDSPYSGGVSPDRCSAVQLGSLDGQSLLARGLVNADTAAPRPATGIWC